QAPCFVNTRRQSEDISTHVCARDLGLVHKSGENHIGDLRFAYPTFQLLEKRSGSHDEQRAALIRTYLAERLEKDHGLLLWHKAGHREDDRSGVVGNPEAPPNRFSVRR